MAGEWSVASHGRGGGKAPWAARGAAAPVAGAAEPEFAALRGCGGRRALRRLRGSERGGLGGVSAGTAAGRSPWLLWEGVTVVRETLLHPCLCTQNQVPGAKP